MKKRFYFPAILFLISTSMYAQSPNVNAFQEIKKIAQSEIIRLPDSSIVYPLTGIVNIINKMGRVPYTEIELWTIDATGKIIYSNTIATKNNGQSMLDAEYCHYQKLQGQYAMKQRHLEPLASR